MPDWVSTLLGAFGGSALTGILAMIKSNRLKKSQQGAKQTAFEAAILALLHDRIFSIYDSCKAKKCASVEDIRNLEYLYKPYHALGGNGTGTEIYERIKNMPDRPAEQEAV
jgi:hypothetical protein